MKRKSIIISVHGIRTHGLWQEKLTEVIDTDEFIHRPFKFGYYDLFHFINPFSNKRMVEQFYLFYCNAINDNDVLPCVIAHSFGTYIIAHCLLKRQHIKFDKIIFCGSIISRNFDWNTLLARNQANQIRNEFSKLDVWTRIVKYFVRKTGDSGFSGTNYKRPNFFEHRFDYGHSDYFLGNHIKEYWIPFLKQNTPIFEVANGRDLHLKKYYSTLSECRNIDIECYKGVINNMLPNGLTQKWISVNDDIYTFVYEKKSSLVKGYINAMPLTNEAFEKITTGAILDDELNENHIMPFIKNTELKMYFMSIATKLDVRQFRGGLINTVGDRLFAGFFKKLIDYWEIDKIKITEFAAVAWTPQGKRICEIIGMNQVGTDRFNHPIFLIKIRDLKNSRNYFIQGIDNLLKAYGMKS